MPRPTKFSFQRAQDDVRTTRMRLDGLDRQAATGRILSYQPTIVSSATPPVIQPAALAGRYLRHKDFLTAWVDLVIAGTFNAGTGAWLISLPFAAEAALTGDVLLGQWRSKIGGVIGRGDVLSYPADRSKVYCDYPAAYPVGAPSQVSVGVPGTWAAGSELHLLVHAPIAA